MALVSKIRDKSGLIVFIVGLGLLLFIIPFDSIYSFFGGRGEQPIGEIYGKPIYSSEWDVMAGFNQNAGYYSSFEGGEAYKVSDEKNYFDQKMLDTILNTEIAKVGLKVSSAELKDYLILGQNPSPIVINTARSFYGMDENVEESVVIDSIPKMHNFFYNKISSTTGEEKAYWNNQWYYAVEQPAKRQRLVSKYVAMAKYGVVATTDEAIKYQIAQNSKLTVDVLYKEASTIADSTVSVSESAIKSYYEAHKNDPEWKITEDIAKIDFVLINVDPTPEDLEETIEKTGKLVQGFASAQNDTAFIDLKADTKFGDNLMDETKLDVIPATPFVRSQTLWSENVNDQIEAAKPGEVVGPFTYTFGGKTKVVLAKVRSVVNDTKVRHILVTDQKLADSLASVLIEDSTKFAALGKEFSTDPGFAENGGYYDVLPSSGLVPTFKAFALENGVGTVGVVPSQFGFHVMQVVSKGDQEYKYVAYLEKNVTATEDTRNVVYEQQGFGFMEAAQTDYESAIEKFGFDSRSANLMLSVPILNLDGKYVFNEELMNWLFAEGRQPGDISVPIELRDGRFLVAKVNGIGNYGVPSYEISKEDIKNKLIKEAKIKHIQSQLKGVGSLQEAEGILGGAGIMNDQTITLDMDALPGYGADAKAIARMFLIKNLNEMSIIEGDQGVYVAVVKDRSITPVSADKTEALAAVSFNRQQYVDRTITNALLKIADVRDWRMKAQVYYANQD